MIHNNTMVTKAQLRRAADAMVEAFKADGGKVRRIACEGKTPRFGSHYCDPRLRGELNAAMVQRPVRAAGARMSMGQSRLIRG